jgi:uncharacterized membrane protein
MKNFWLDSITLDEIALFIFVSCVSLYFLMLIYTKLRPKHSKRQLFNLIYENWVENRLKDDSPLTAVQAIRNFIMGCSTFVSILFVLLGIIIGFSSTTFLEEKTFLGLKTIMLGAVELTLNVILIIFSLFNFILATRYATRLSLIISGNPEKYSVGDRTGISLAQKTFKSAQNHWMFGVRGIFYLIATLVWFLDAIFFIIATLLVTIYLVGFQDFWIFSKKK